MVYKVAWSNYRRLTDKWAGVCPELCNMILLHERDQPLWNNMNTMYGSIGWSSYSDSSCTRNTAPLGECIMSLQRQIAAVAILRQNNLVKQCRTQRVFGEKYLLVQHCAVFIVSCIINVVLKSKDSPRCASLSLPASWVMCSSFSETFGRIAHCA